MEEKIEITKEMSTWEKILLRIFTLGIGLTMLYIQHKSLFTKRTKENE